MLKVTATINNITAGLISLGCTLSAEDHRAIGEVVHLLDADAEVELENREGKITMVFLVDVRAQHEHLQSFTAIEESLGYNVDVSDADDVTKIITLEKKEAHMSNSATPSTPLDLPGSMQESLKAALEKSNEATKEAVSITKEFTKTVDHSRQLNERAEKMIKDGAEQLGAAMRAAAAAPKAPWYKGTVAKLTLGATVVGAVAAAGYYSWKSFKSAE